MQYITDHPCDFLVSNWLEESTSKEWTNLTSMSIVDAKEASIFVTRKRQKLSVSVLHIWTRLRKLHEQNLMYNSKLKPVYDRALSSNFGKRLLAEIGKKLSTKQLNWEKLTT